MAFRKVNCVSQFDYTTQKVGPGSEALDDARNLLPAGAFAPEVIGRSGTFEQLLLVVTIRLNNKPERLAGRNSRFNHMKILEVTRVTMNFPE
jgi:hypothetical protein